MFNNTKTQREGMDIINLRVAMAKRKLEAGVNWCFENPEKVIFSLVAIGYGVAIVNTIRNGALERELMAAEIASKTAYAKHFG